MAAMTAQLPSLEQIWGLRCPDCRSTVTVVMAHDSVPMLRVVHSFGCPIPPDHEHRVWWGALPMSYQATFDQSTEEEQ